MGRWKGKGDWSKVPWQPNMEVRKMVEVVRPAPDAIGRMFKLIAKKGTMNVRGSQL